jgi:hypothetical protein
VAVNIRRKEVEAVLACLPAFQDNANIDDDGYFKVSYIII